jgi:hypothetical protein
MHLKEINKCEIYALLELIIIFGIEYQKTLAKTAHNIYFLP